MIKNLLAVFGIGAARLAANDDLLFLSAISQIESGNNDQAVSRSGAKGRYQIMPATWSQHTTEHFSVAHDRKIATQVALKHVAWLRLWLNAQLKEEGSPDPASYFQIANAWKAGLNYRKRPKSTADLDYSVRVISLFNDIKHRAHK